MNLNALYAFCMLICGISTAVVPFLSDYTGLAIMAGLFGFFISANYSLTSPILVNYVSLEQFSNAYGLLLLVQGTVKAQFKRKAWGLRSKSHMILIEI